MALNTINNFNFSELRLLKRQKGELDGFVTVPICYGKNNCLVQTPMMKLCDKPKSKLLIPLLGKTDASTLQLKKFFNAFDTYIIKSLKDVGKQLELKNLSYNPIVKELENDNDKNYENGLVVLNYSGAAVYDSDKKKVDPSTLERDIFIKCILEFQSLVVNTKTSFVDVHICVQQIKMDQEEKMQRVELTEYSFVDTEEEATIVKKGVADEKIEEDDLEACDLHNLGDELMDL